MNPGLLEMMANDRSREMRAAAVNWSARSAVHTVIAGHPAPRRSSPQVRLANPQQAIGWFLVSVGLRLAMPRTPSSSAR
jgi:hypothetical protein